MDIETRIKVATAAMDAYDSGAPASEGFVALMHDWAVEVRPHDPELADRLAATELR